MPEKKIDEKILKHMTFAEARAMEESSSTAKGMFFNKSDAAEKLDKYRYSSDINPEAMAELRKQIYRELQDQRELEAEGFGTGDTLKEYRKRVRVEAARERWRKSAGDRYDKYRKDVLSKVPASKRKYTKIPGGEDSDEYFLYRAAARSMLGVQESGYHFKLTIPHDVSNFANRIRLKDGSVPQRDVLRPEFIVPSKYSEENGYTVKRRIDSVRGRKPVGVVEVYDDKGNRVFSRSNQLKSWKELKEAMVINEELNNARTSGGSSEDPSPRVGGGASDTQESSDRRRSLDIGTRSEKLRAVDRDAMKLLKSMEDKELVTEHDDGRITYADEAFGEMKEVLRPEFKVSEKYEDDSKYDIKRFTRDSGEDRRTAVTEVRDKQGNLVMSRSANLQTLEQMQDTLAENARIREQRKKPAPREEPAPKRDAPGGLPPVPTSGGAMRVELMRGGEANKPAGATPFGAPRGDAPEAKPSRVNPFANTAEKGRLAPPSGVNPFSDTGEKGKLAAPAAANPFASTADRSKPAAPSRVNPFGSDYDERKHAPRHVVQGGTSTPSREAIGLKPMSSKKTYGSAGGGSREAIGLKPMSSPKTYADAPAMSAKPAIPAAPRDTAPTLKEQVKESREVVASMPSYNGDANTRNGTLKGVAKYTKQGPHEGLMALDLEYT